MKFLVIFLCIIGILRAYETFYFDRDRKKGIIYSNWTLVILGINYVLVILSSVTEYVVMKREINLLITGIAVGIMILRLVIKNWAVGTLKEYWSANVEIRDDHKLIREGPYKYSRHPVYLSNLMDFLAIGLFLNSYYTILWSLPLQFFFISLRIKEEEKRLLEKFGDEYLKYKQETFAVLPTPKIF